MRSILALSLLIALCASANAATVHRTHRRHANVPPNQGSVSSSVSGWAYAPSGPPVQYRPVPQTPSRYENRYPNWGGM